MVDDCPGQQDRDEDGGGEDEAVVRHRGGAAFAGEHERQVGDVERDDGREEPPVAVVVGPAAKAEGGFGGEVEPGRALQVEPEGGVGEPGDESDVGFVLENVEDDVARGNEAEDGGDLGSAEGPAQGGPDQYGEAEPGEQAVRSGIRTRSALRVRRRRRGS